MSNHHFHLPPLSLLFWEWGIWVLFPPCVHCIIHSKVVRVIEAHPAGYKVLNITWDERSSYCRLDTHTNLLSDSSKEYVTLMKDGTLTTAVRKCTESCITNHQVVVSCLCFLWSSKIDPVICHSFF